jgi:chemotaxis signal transduction protein
MPRFPTRASLELDSATREMLAQRAERLRSPLPAVIDEAVAWIAEFQMGEDRFALPLASLRAVVSLRRVTPIPLSPPHVIGILRFQGQIITALSLASLLGVKGWSQDPAVLLVIDSGWGHLVALDCEEIPKPTTISSQLLDTARSDQTAFVEVTVGTQLVHYINPANLLDRRTRGRGGA